LALKSFFLANHPKDPLPMPSNILQDNRLGSVNVVSTGEYRRNLLDPVKSPEQLRKEARMEMGIDCYNCYNFGVAGTSGSGKSSMINALRGFKDSQRGAAVVGLVECTTSIEKYEYPNHPHVVLWDIPGGGTPKQKADSYFLGNKLYAFDMLIIVTANRFTDLDLIIAESAHKYNVPIVFVRSKSDIDIDNASRGQRHKSKEDIKNEVKRQVVNNIKGELPNVLKDREVFVVSSRVMGPPDEQQNFDQDTYALDEGRMVEHVLQVALARRNVKF